MVEYYVLGAGGQARQVMSIATKTSPILNVRGFIGLEEEKGKLVNNIKVISELDIGSLDRDRILLLNGLGRPNRKNVIERLMSKRFIFKSLVHTSTYIG